MGRLCRIRAKNAICDGMGIVAVDTGGTFTDLVYRDDAGRSIHLKVPSDPDAPERAVLRALRALLEHEPNAAWQELRHGSTVATNAILERNGARTLFITTAGFEDLLILRRQSRPSLYALHPRVPAPLTHQCLGIDERVRPSGEIARPLTDLARWVNTHRTKLSGAESIAICLLHAYRNPTHEQALAAYLRDTFPSTPVTASSELIPLFREYERASTTVVNAYVGPVMTRYLNSLTRELHDHSISIMGSAGGLLDVDHVAQEPVHTVLSGPAGGVRGAFAAGLRCQRTQLITLDMGGTSTDVSVVRGELLADDEGSIDDIPLRVALLPIATVGAGGGSIAFVDEGGVLKVGPQSTGARPGPACYGLGGNEPTVTDAHVVLGRLNSLLGGDMPLDVKAAKEAVGQLAETLGTSVEDCARAILATAEASTARACKSVALDHGIDPRDLTLVAFGGAGGLHACALADELGCRDVLFPEEPGVLSAEGIGRAPYQRTASITLLCAPSEIDVQSLSDHVETLVNQLRDPSCSVRIWIETRYRGQTYTLAVPIALDSHGLDSRLETDFVAMHRQRYGYALEGRPIQAASARILVEHQVLVQRTDLSDAEASVCSGPAPLSSYGATLWVPAGWRAERLPSGDWRVEREAQGSRLARIDAPQLGLEVHRHRLAAVADEMGSALMRSAFSANIKERRDFSCAIFDGQGQMISQAAHIPVHLGSQPLSVQSALAEVPMRPGMSVVLNAPFSGGTHLPDVTLVTPVFVDGEDQPRYLVANRAHHADVGGVSPGSMPAALRADGSLEPLSIDDEGFVIEPQPLTEAIRRDFAESSRTPEERYGDLRAQEAANHVGVRRMLELLEEIGAERMSSHNEELLDYSERRMRRIVSELPDGEWSFEDALDDDGFNDAPLPIRVTLHVEGDSIAFDFRDSAPQSQGSLNAVRAITESAVFYAMRCLGADELPSNSGLMRPVEVKTQPGTVVDAISPAAVSGGNVETSQRLVDVIFGALAQAAPHRIPAASGGTMNNVLIGGTDPLNQRAFVHYETLASGAGGGPGGVGADAIQSHMTNTLNTPVEELEAILPIEIESYALRETGPHGPHRGGRGVSRAYRFLSPAEVTVISERRRLAPYGLGGAPSGVPGKNTLIDAVGRVTELSGKATVRVKQGDTLVIETPSGGSWTPS
ncbi:MAG: hydantoinase B/oxoprolinase family protein [Myxococcota bacterium]